VRRERYGGNLESARTGPIKKKVEGEERRLDSGFLLEGISLERAPRADLL